MAFVIKYRVIIIALFFSIFGFVFPLVLRIGELRWYYTAITPVLALLVDLLLSFVIRTRWETQKFINKLRITGVVLSSLLVIVVFLYTRVYIKTTFRYKDHKGIARTYVKGNVYTPLAIQYKKENPDLVSDVELLYDGFGGAEGKNEFWTPASIEKNIFRLIIFYCIVVIVFAVLLSWLMHVAGSLKRLNESSPEELTEIVENSRSNYDNYLETYSLKQTEPEYKHIKFHIFLSYSSEQKNLAENIYYSLLNTGHMVFFDRENLPAGMEFNMAIHNSIEHSDAFIFLISPEAVKTGHYTLSELRFARERWPAANGNLLPVMAVETPYDNIPVYAKSVTIFKAEGNLPAEVTAEIERMYIARQPKTDDKAN